MRVDEVAGTVRYGPTLGGERGARALLRVRPRHHLLLGPGRCCLPRHGMPLDSRNEDIQIVHLVSYIQKVHLGSHR